MKKDIIIEVENVFVQSKNGVIDFMEKVCAYF
jgi:hypothetical protein